MLAYVNETPALAPLVGILALGAAVIGWDAHTRALLAAKRADDLREEVEDRRVEVVGLRDEATELRRQLERAETTLDEAAANQAGSFERKFESTGPAPTPPAGQADARSLTDPETELFSEAYFRVALDARIASARRHLRPVAIAVVEVIEGAEFEGGNPADPMKFTSSIRQTLRDADTACRLADGSFALILEDTPENGAVWTVERIRRNLTSRHGHHTLWAGVACYPAHAFSTDELLDQAELALESAKEWKQDRIEVATAD